MEIRLNNEIWDRRFIPCLKDSYGMFMDDIT